MKKLLPFNIFKCAFKLSLPILIGLSAASIAEAQSGFIYRTKQTGFWNDYTTWERAATTSPTSFNPLLSGQAVPNRNAGTIEIMDTHTVTYDYPNNVDQIIIKPGGVFELPAGKSLSLYVAPATDRIVVEGVNGNQGVFRNLGGTVSFTNGTSAVTSNIEVGAYGKYEHAPDATVGTVPFATWDATSTIEFKITGVFNGLTYSDYINRGFSQTFGNVKWNTTSNTSNLDLKGVITNVQGNFEVVSTGTGSSGSSGSALVLSSDGNYNLTIGKSLIVSGPNSDLVFSSSSAPSGGSLSMVIGEGMNITNGGAIRNNKVATPVHILFSGTGLLQNTSTSHLYNVNYEIGLGATITLGSDITMPGAVSGGSASNFVVNGKLKTAAYAFEGNGNFTVANNASIHIGSSAGISAAGPAGNIKVGGTRNFSSLGNYIYNGSAAQVTGTGLPASIASLEVENQAGLSLSQPVTITGNLKMTEGLITSSNTNRLVIASTGNVTMPASDKVSYVNGPIEHTVDGFNFAELVTFKFPVGKNGVYRPIELTVFQFEPDPTFYSAEQFEQAHPSTDPLPATINKISKMRYFRINKSTGVEVTAQIKLIYLATDGVTDFQNLTIAKYNNTTKWVDIIGTATGNGAGAVTSDFFDNFSDFVLANRSGGSNPLPVELISFQAKPAKTSVALNWETASEKNSDRFEVERSLNGADFEKIATVKGNGTTSLAKAYSLNDFNPANGLNYYRLKQVDLDGTFTYSQIVKAQLNGMANQFRFYPNPANEYITVQAGKQGILKITNVLGQVVYSQEIKNQSAQVISIATLKAGIYNLNLESETGIEKQKFVKAGL